MLQQFEQLVKEIPELLDEWMPQLLKLSTPVITERKNNQNRSIKMIIGHMADSASNNTHRVVHLQYQKSPFEYPNYASNGNNDRWIAIQNYQNEDWELLLNHWKYSNLHYIHVIRNIKEETLENKWIAAPDKLISLNEMTLDYLRHFKLHLGEIEELINKQ
jgi:hypothetical protein